jgi:voltage-gated sodium channel
MLVVNLTITAGAGVICVTTSEPGVDYTNLKRNMVWLMRIVFLIEFLLKVLAEGAAPYRYFSGSNAGWNTFDAIILAVTWVPNATPALASLRSLRLLKLLRSANAHNTPQLTIVLAAFKAGIEAFRYIGVLWLLLIYIYGLIGKIMFCENDPDHFGSLHESMYTLFGISTFDGKPIASNPHT